MKFDALFPIIGDFGPYQKRVYLLLCLPAICCAMHKLAWVFLGAKIDHRCLLPVEFENNATYDHLPLGIWPNMTFPPDPKNSKVPWDSCSRLEVNFSDPSYFQEGIPSNKAISCDGKFVYDFSKYQSSARLDYDLKCKRTFLYTNAQNLFMVGIMLGSIVFGDLSDRFGRRPVFFFSLVLQVVFGILAGLAPEYWTFVIARMIVGSSTSGIFLVGYVIAMEMVGPSRRTFVGVACQLFFTAGYIVTALFAYFIRDWKILQIALSLPGLVFLSYYWFLPESVRWLLARGRRDEAKAILKNVALENKVVLTEDVYENLSAEEPSEKKSTSILAIFRYRRLGLRAINIFFNWFVNSGVYYGLSLNTSNLGGNDYLNFTIAGLVEVPAYTFLLISLQRFGRKIVLCGCMLAGGAFMMACAIVPDEPDWNWVVITFAMIGKMCITASYGVIYIFTAESFPTVVRNGGVGASSMFARVGGIVANSLLILGEIWKPLPLLIFGSASLLAGLLALCIPETFGKQLPETLEDGENFGLRDAKDADLDDLTGGREEHNKDDKVPSTS
ncbi:organic cation transporter protein isoform X2 [Folsomia candida]|nr:organic cation transporter protein isoform X2 [Folsomia candida]